MKNLLMLALSLPLVACVVDVDEGPGTTPPPPGNGNEVSGSITQSGTWSGTIVVKGPTTIETGATITVAAGTTIDFIGSNSLTIKGTLDIQGTAAAKVNLKPQTGTFFGGISNSGTLKMAYALQRGGGIYGQSGSITITDSQLSGVQGDLIVLGGGSFNASYSQFGIPTDTTHCELHFNGGSPISITKSNIVGAPYGFMEYGGAGTYTDNNWFGNDKHIDRSGATGTFTNNWFEGGTAKLSGFAPADLPTSAAARLTGTGPRG
ncbi:MAG: hypothetical protein IPI49_25740 [Myxococcales bacterium]|nr:hypothetical protein [Myxococcales bacterium]